MPTRGIEERLAQGRERPLGSSRRSACQGVHPFRKRDPEVAGLEATPGLVGWHLGRHRPERTRHTDGQETPQDQNAPAHLPLN